ncbi:MAG TPA: AbrB/MazE/SpoVT family DNA-binding domain-containing protein [Candidatus Bipolaricaulota bacterium]
MPLGKVGTRHQVTIPKKIVDKLKLKPGDYVEISLKDNTVYITPKAIIDREDAWFWSRKWQQKEREADEALAKGDVIGPFKNAKEAIKALKKTKP